MAIGMGWTTAALGLFAGLGLGLGLAVPGAAAAQASSVKAEELMADVQRDAAAYDARLPSLSCRESIVMDEMKHGAVKKTTRIEGTLRVVRTEDAKTPLREEHHFTSRNGANVEDGQKIGMTYWVSGGFANGLGHAFAGSEVCFDLAAAPVAGTETMRLELTRRAGSDALAVCREHALPGYRKTLVLDAEGNVLHVDRTVPPEVAGPRREVAFAAVDFRPVQLGAQTLWLPVRLESHDPKDENRLEVRYSECRLFSSSITITPGVTKVPGP